jgi:hypothetical protein
MAPASYGVTIPDDRRADSLAWFDSLIHTVHPHALHTEGGGKGGLGSTPLSYEIYVCSRRIIQVCVVNVGVIRFYLVGVPDRDGLGGPWRRDLDSRDAELRVSLGTSPSKPLDLQTGLAATWRQGHPRRHCLGHRPQGPRSARTALGVICFFFFFLVFWKLKVDRRRRIPFGGFSTWFFLSGAVCLGTETFNLEGRPPPAGPLVCFIFDWCRLSRHWKSSDLKVDRRRQISFGTSLSFGRFHRFGR